MMPQRSSDPRRYLLPSPLVVVLSLLQPPFFLCPASLSPAHYHSDTNHHATAYRSRRPCFCLYYHPLPQLRDPFRSNRNKCHYTRG
ncbi:hypothetical protein B296_00022897 [Ensete ventricosum]|uniref:Uncharacterized protein n=1 Tax=Ensete ventricosum TaxID=4639 RepID=A0A426ZGN3_ENSVE|nr:hypothetical protein B296_00022897 [Ensete ventricosum]